MYEFKKKKGEIKNQVRKKRQNEIRTMNDMEF